MEDGRKKRAGMEVCVCVCVASFYWGVPLSCACCLGNKVDTSTGEQCILVDLCNLCV